MAAASLIGGTFWAQRFGESRCHWGTASRILLQPLDALHQRTAVPLRNPGLKRLWPRAHSSFSDEHEHPGVPDARKGTAMGFFQATYALGMFAGPALSGMISEVIGLRGIFLCTGGLGLVTALGAQRLLRSPIEAGIEERI